MYTKADSLLGKSLLDFVEFIVKMEAPVARASVPAVASR